MLNRTRRREDAVIIDGLADAAARQTHRGDYFEQAIADLQSRLRHFSDRLNDARDKGDKAATVVLNRITTERSQHVAQITGERQDWAAEREQYAALLVALWGIVTRAPLALPAPPQPPLALPRGAGFLVEPDLLLPADEEDAGSRYWAPERLPSRQAVSA